MTLIFNKIQGSVQIQTETYRNLNILGHAQIEQLEIGSRCGGHGVCGGDRVKIEAVTGAISPPTDAERKHLSTAEIALGWRLACQCFPETDNADIRVKVP